ncbi:MAG TPA: ATPase [Methylocystis sp.]|nr:ATPase [Methylocystis sp.]
MISSAFAQEAPQEGEAATHTGTVERGGAHESAFPPFDSSNFAPQLVWLALIFGLLYILMSTIALPRVKKILVNRRTTIDSDLEASRELQAKAHSAAQRNEATLQAKKEEAQGIGREAHEKIAAEIGAARASAEQRFATALAEAEARIAGEKKQALTHVESIATGAAASIVEKLTGVGVDPATVASAYANVTR